MRCFSSVKPELLRWLWPARIPLGKLTLLVGDPGLGKSLVTLDIAARVSTGRKFPDGAECHPGCAILLSAEDDAADTIRPRLDAAKAEVSRVHLLEAAYRYTEDGMRIEASFSLEQDIPALEDAIERTGARLVIIDPISAYLGNVDSHLNAEVRGLLSPLAALATRRETAVIGVTHLRKSPGAAIYRAIGSLAFAAAARSVWGVSADPNDKTRRLIVPVKQNLGPDVGGLAYRIEAPTPPGIALVAWEGGAVTLDAESLMSGAESEDDRSELRDAEEWIKDFLSEGPQLVPEIRRQATQAALSWTTVRRAFKGVRGVTQKTGGRGAPWQWSLSHDAAKDAQSSAVKDAHTNTSKLSTFDEKPENKGDKPPEDSKMLNISCMSTFEEKKPFEEGEI
ncbi:MAG: AAA family ATPase [Terriglobia bacterium]